MAKAMKTQGNKEDITKRLIEFIESTGLSKHGFQQECNLKSYGSIFNLYKGVVPTQKTLKIIIERFPNLSYDWLLFGTGNMILTEHDKDDVSKEVRKISRRATSDQLYRKIQDQEYAIDNLSKKIDGVVQFAEENRKFLSKKLGDYNIVIENVMTTIENVVKKVELTLSSHYDIIQTLDKSRKDFVRGQIEDQNEKTQDYFDKILEKFSTLSEKARIDAITEINKFQESGRVRALGVLQKHNQEVLEMSSRAMELGEKALAENKKALENFNEKLKDYAIERDKKAEEITLINVQKLFNKLLEEEKGLGKYIKVKKN